MIRISKESDNSLFKILLVDDNQANLTIARMMFERIGIIKKQHFVIFCANNGEEAL
jgi:CheY-like chemotaxis protein